MLLSVGLLFQRDFGVLHRKGLPLLREIEHIQDDGFGATVLAVVDGAYHFDDCLTLVHRFLAAVLAYNGQLALHQYAVVHHRMVVPAKFLSGREFVAHSDKLGLAFRIVGQVGTVPTLGGAQQFLGGDLGGGVVFDGCFVVFSVASAQEKGCESQCETGFLHMF